MEGQEDKVTCQDHILISKRLTLCYPDFLGEIINVGTDPCYIVIYFFFSQMVLIPQKSQCSLTSVG